MSQTYTPSGGTQSGDTQSGDTQSGGTQSGKKLSNWQIGSFSFMAMPIAALGLPLVVHLPPFYISELGISATAVGLVFMFARFWDVFTDPFFGALSDHVRTRWGRRRHWIVLAVPLQILCAWYLFMPSGETSTPLYLGFWLFMIYIATTMISISHMSWGAELSPDYHERARIQGWREVTLIVGMICVLGLPAIWEVFDLLGEISAVLMMGIFVMVSTPLCALITLGGTPQEKVPARSVAQFDWKAAMRFFASDAILRRLLIADLMVGLLYGITGALYIYLITDVFLLGADRNLLLLVYFLSSVCSVPIWIWISKYLGKHRTLAMAMIYGIITLSTAFFLPHGMFWVAFFWLMAYGVAYGAGPFLLRALMADFADFDQIKSGQQRTGLCYSLLNMVDKIGYAVSVGITYPLLDLIMFETEIENSPETLNLLLGIYIIFPCLCMLTAFLLMWNYPLSQKQQEKTRNQLEASA